MTHLSLVESGIHSHSMPDDGYIIFSVFQYKEPDIINHSKILDILRNNKINFKVVEGMYNNKWELSILVPFEHELLVQSICWEYNQECYLVLKPHKHGVRKATLVFKGSNNQSVGYFMSVPEELATKQPSWTYDPSTKLYYTTTPTDDTMGTYGGLNVPTFKDELLALLSKHNASIGINLDCMDIQAVNAACVYFKTATEEVVTTDIMDKSGSESDKDGYDYDVSIPTTTV